MKNIFTLLLLVSVAIFANAQTLPNNDLETWQLFNAGGFNEYEEPENWHTPNPFTIQIAAQGVTKSEDAFAGAYSARLETIDLLGGLYQAPGLLTLADFTVDISTFDYSFSGGFFLQENVAKLSGMYKYTGINHDSASVIIYNFKHPEGEPMDTIGFGLSFLHDAEEWTPFEVNMMLNETQMIPDTFNVIILSSGSTDLNVGSILFIDSLTIETNTGIIGLSKPLKPLHVYPNPGIETVTFEAADRGSKRELFINDASGRQVIKVDFSGLTKQVDISSFSSGLFSYKLVENGKYINSGTFIKK